MFGQPKPRPAPPETETVTRSLTLYPTDDLLKRAKNIVALLPMGMPTDFANTCVLKVHEILDAYAKLDADNPAKLSPSVSRTTRQSLPTPDDQK